MARLTKISPRVLRGWPLPVPKNGDKESRGRVFIVAGAPEMPGAAILAATAALRAGAGKLKVGVPRSVSMHVATAIPESLTIGYDESGSGAIGLGAARDIAARANEGDALVIGPGMSDPDACTQLIEAMIPLLNVPMVMDATALTALHDRPRLLERLRGRVVLTPHPGEMATMLSRSRDHIERNPERWVGEAAHRYRAVVALKGSRTLIAAPKERTYVNESGTVGLATSGSGDTLSGVIGGLLARGAEPLQAAAWGVYVHACAGEVLQRKMGMGFLARELLAEIPPVLQRLGAA